jgi:predicted nucleic acid-binding protein
MRYVLDSSVALKWVLAEPDSPRAIRLRDDRRAGVHEFLAPDLLPIELGHALLKAERRRRIPRGVAWPAWLFIMADAPMEFPYAPLMPRAFAISSTSGTGLYDCLYVALAEREGCELVTADDRLVRNLQPHFPFIVPLISLP